MDPSNALAIGVSFGKCAMRWFREPKLCFQFSPDQWTNPTASSLTA